MFQANREPEKDNEVLKRKKSVGSIKIYIKNNELFTHFFTFTRSMFLSDVLQFTLLSSSATT